MCSVYTLENIVLTHLFHLFPFSSSYFFLLVWLSCLYVLRKESIWIILYGHSYSSSSSSKIVQKKKLPFCFSFILLIIIIVSLEFIRDNNLFVHMWYFTSIKENIFLSQWEDELNFCTEMNVLSRSHRTFFFQLFIFSSFFCSFFQSVNANEHYIDIYIPFF